MNKMVFGALGASLSMSVCADGSANFQNDLQYSKSLVGDVSASLKQFNPSEMIPGYSNAPKEASYYSGDISTQSDETIKSDSKTVAITDPTSKYVIENASKRQDPKIDPESNMMRKSALIVSDADNIARGKSDQYVDCTKDARRGGIVCGG